MSKKDRKGMVAMPWITEESKRLKKLPDELYDALLALTLKYGIGGLLVGVGIFCDRARSATSSRPLNVIGQKIFSFVAEVNDEIEKNLLDKKEEGSPFVHAVKSKLTN